MLRKAYGLQLIAALICLIYLQLTQPLKFNTDLSKLFTLTNNNPQTEQVLSRFAELNESQNVILVAHAELQKAINDAQRLQQKLLQFPQVESAQSQFDLVPSIQEILAFYQPYRHLLLSPEFQDLLAQKNADELFKKQFNLLNQVANPVVAGSLAIDPSLSLADYLMNLPQKPQKLQQQDGYAYVKQNDLYYVLVRFATAQSGLALSQSHQLVQQLTLINQTLSSQTIAAGQVFYADYAGQTAQHEMFLFSAISVLGLIVLIFLAYRNFAALLMTLMLIGLSLLYGYLALTLFFDEVHILTFVFAVTLVGIAADYSFHALTELAQQTQAGGAKLHLANIRRPLIMGFLSTAIGYVILMFTPFEIFLQVAVFILAGLSAALITVLLCFADIAAYFKLSASAQQQRWLMRLNAIQRNYSHKKYTSVCLLVLCLGGGFFLSTVTFNDNVRSFYRVSDEIRQNETLMRDILGFKDEFQFILVEGASESEVLQAEEAVVGKLKILQQQGVIHSFSAISQWLPSQPQQQRNYTLMQQALSQNLLTPFLQALSLDDFSLNPSEQFLSVDDWLNSQSGRAFKMQWFAQPQAVFSVIKLQGISDIEQLQASFTQDKQVKWVDKAALISEQLSVFRAKLMLLLALSLTLAWAVLAWVYGLKKSIVVVLIPTTSVVLALLVSVLIQSHLNVFNTLASVLIIALGLDYAVFYADNGLLKKISFTTLVSAFSSILVFAVLVLSVTPAIFSFGLTVLIGIVVTYLLSPCAAGYENKE